MLNPYQKRLMAEGFLLRLQEAEDKVALVIELMDESAAQLSVKPIDLNESPYECNPNVENIND